jgi:tetratricopeptide (TPR) repeat protein
MKLYKTFASIALGALALSSCSLDTPVYDQTDDPFNSLKGIETGMNGAYYQLAYYPFLGNYAQTLGDFTSDISTGSSSSGHLYAFSTFTFDDTQEELENMWEYGYRVIGQSQKTINAADSLIKAGAINSGNQPTAYNYIGQCYAMKALSAWYLVNYFALPYNSANLSTPGIKVIDTTVPAAFEQVQRGTVKESYDQIVKDMNSAEAAFAKAGNSAETSPYYLGTMGLKALEARVYLSMGEYAKAVTAAKAALALKSTTAKGDSTDTALNDSLTYSDLWGQVTSTDEDLFTLKKSENDNLSANAINTLYGSYYATFQTKVLSSFGKNDIRRGLLRASKGGGTSSIKFDGRASQAVSNVPVFRKSEMSLIIAECDARLGNLKEAQDYLLYTARRNKDIKYASDLPQTAEELLSFIADERVREFFGEGHRFFDARRMDLTITPSGFNAWQVSKFVYPIPQYELNSGFGIQQNKNWSDALPTAQ